MNKHTRSITLSISMLLIAGLNASAQVTDTGNQVGIGNAAPTYKLDVSGDINLTAGNVIRIGGNQVFSTEGTKNMFLGDGTGTNLTTGSYNAAIGFKAGEQLTTGQFNTIIGLKAGQNMTAANSNVLIGIEAGKNNTGNQNVLIGRRAAISNQGVGNTVVGDKAGLAITTGSGITLIGKNANVGSGTLTNATAIGAAAIVNTSNALVLGNGANVGIGTSAPSYDLDVVGDINFTGTLYENGVVFSSPVFGTTSNTTSNENGDYAIDSFVFGSPQLNNDGNIAHNNRMFFDKLKGAFRVGRASGTNWDTDSLGSYSVAFGDNSKAMGYSSTALGNNTEAIGYSSTALGGYAVATGLYSMAFGYFTEATGSYSTAMGKNTTATGSNSMAMGSLTTATGGSSTAMGSSTEATGTVSTAMGSGTKAIGSYSTAMGRSTEATGDYSTAMGYQTEVTGDYSTAMGNTTTASGLASTAMGLQTVATGAVSTAMGEYTNAESGFETVIGRYDTDYTATSTVGWFPNDRLFVIGKGISNATRSDAMVVLKDGNTGIGTSTPGYLLHVNGSAAKPGGGSWTTASDRRLKQNIKPYTEGLKQLLSIKPVKYQYNELLGTDTKKEYIGVIAQELKEVAPYMVGTFEMDSTEYYDVDNSAMMYMLINSIKEQQIQIEGLAPEGIVSRQEFEELRSENNELKDRLERMEELISRFDTDLQQCCTNWTEGGATGNPQPVTRNSQPLLEQNQPNPFRENSTIKYYLPSNTQTAQLIISNLNGVVLKTFNLEGKGFGQILISGGSFAAGTYLYTLNVDGKKVATKKMMLL